MFIAALFIVVKPCKQMLIIRWMDKKYMYGMCSVSTVYFNI